MLMRHKTSTEHWLPVDRLPSDKNRMRQVGTSTSSGNLEEGRGSFEPGQPFHVVENMGIETRQGFTNGPDRH